ncbi:MAG: helix-hairpin-helix domain-containing protein [Chitinophagaceae bacterium]|nr:helix-hairpin-helix domain-containing protein [Chitinophagaceae bacterium]
MKLSEFLTDYLTFTKKDRIGIIVLLLIITGVFFLPKIISNSSGNTSSAPVDTTWIMAMKRLEQKVPGITESHYADNNSVNYQFDRQVSYPGKPNGELFYFDPNTLSADGWQKLGLREKTIRTIQNYLSKGGQFRKPEDLQRVYGLFPDEFERLFPYIRIEVPQRENANAGFPDNRPPGEMVTKNYAPRYSIVNLNTADTSALIALPGIGSKLALRIINFRDKLGGFYTVNQVSETFGLPDSTFQKIKQYLVAESNAVRKININTATVDELKAHPYIKWAIANPIIAYRKEHGPFVKVEDIKKVMAVTEDIYQKTAPYLSVE